MRNFLAALSGGSGAFAAAGVCLLLVVAGFYIQSGRNAVEDVAVAPVTVVDKAPEPEAPKPVTEPAPEQTPSQETAQSEEPASPPVAVPAPSFDEVSRETDGVTVVAGQGAPGARIKVLQNGVEIASATADGAGKFAAIAMIPPDGQGHVLTLMQSLDGADRASEDEIILAPLAAPVDVAKAEPEAIPQAPEAEIPLTDDAPAEPVVPERSETLELAEASEPETPLPQAVEVETAQGEAVDATSAPVEPTEPAVTQETAEVAQIAPEVPAEESTSTVQDSNAMQEPVAEAPQAAAPQEEFAALEPQAQTEEPTPAEPAAPVEQPAIETAEAPAEDAAEPAPVAVLRSTAEGVELLNTPSPEVMDNVAIDTISYSDTGQVQLTGRAQSNTSAVRIYLDNNAIVNLPVDAEGRWRGDLPDVDEGIYTLRIDEVASDGKVTSRVETPFKREAPETLAAAAADQQGPIKAITVQRGATLWAIARDRYGDGELYVRVFEANREAIRDPDLIYPGQIFDLPD